MIVTRNIPRMDGKRFERSEPNTIRYALLDDRRTSSGSEVLPNYTDRPCRRHGGEEATADRCHTCRDTFVVRGLEYFRVEIAKARRGM